MNMKLRCIVLLLLIGFISVIPVQQVSAAGDKELMKKYGEYLHANYINTSQQEDATFTFIDLNGDKQKELIVCFTFSSSVYNYENGAVQPVDLGNEYKSTLYYSEKNKSYYLVESGGPFLAYYTISINNHKATRKNELRSTSIDDDTEEYTFNGKIISSEKEDSLSKKYYGESYSDKSVSGYKLTASNIKKYCGYTDGQNSSLDKVQNLDVRLEYVKEDYTYNQIYTWDAVSGADGYELYRKMIDIRLYPFSNFDPDWLAVEWVKLADTKTNQVIITKFRPGDRINWYTVRAYRLVNGAKVYGPYGQIAEADELQ